MSTWISDTVIRRAAVIAACLALSGCLDLPDVDQGGISFAAAEAGNGPGRVAAAPSPRSIAAQGVAVRGPRGFCVDVSRSSLPEGQPGFVVLSSCAALGGGIFAPRPAYPALLTATVAPPSGMPPVAEISDTLLAFFATAEGVLALGRGSEGVDLRESFAEDGAVFLSLHDTAPFPGEAVAPGYWRAILDIAEQMVTVSVYSPTDRPMSRDEGLSVLRDFVASLRKPAPSRASPTG